MREAAVRLLAGHGRFESVAGTAEAATLPDESVGLIAAGQAFHRFDAELARKELERVLRPGKNVVLVSALAGVQ